MTGRPRATRQIDLQVIDQVDGLRAAVNDGELSTKRGAR